MSAEGLAPPNPPLRDDVVALRVADVAADVDDLFAYSTRPGGLDGVWVSSLTPGASRDDCAALLTAGLAAWDGAPSRNGRVLVVTPADSDRLIGEVTICVHNDATVELTYGIAPEWRRRSFAARVARLVATWLSVERRINNVELRIGQHHVASQRVAERAGFVQSGTVQQFVKATNQTYEDLRYVCPTNAAEVPG